VGASGNLGSVPLRTASAAKRRGCFTGQRRRRRMRCASCAQRWPSSAAKSTRWPPCSKTGSKRCWCRTRRPGTVTGARSAVSAGPQTGAGPSCRRNAEVGRPRTRSIRTSARQGRARNDPALSLADQCGPAVATAGEASRNHPGSERHHPPGTRTCQGATADGGRRPTSDRRRRRKDPAIGIALLVLAITGLRRGDGARLQWADVNTTTGRLTCGASSTGHPRRTARHSEPKRRGRCEKVVIQEPDWP